MYTTYQIYNLQNVFSFECHNLQDTQAMKYLQEMYTKYNLRKELAISNEHHKVVFIDSLLKPISQPMDKEDMVLETHNYSDNMNH